MAGRLDEDSVLSVDQRQALADEYGVNKSRFWLEADGCTSFLAFNNANRLFKGNARLRRAVNYAIDRTDYTLGGRLVALPWSRLLPPSVVGLHARQPYPAHADLAKARKLARGHFRGGKITVYYRSSGTIGPAQAQVVRNALIALGFKPEKITMKGFSGGNIYTAMGVRGNDADIGISMGWCSDYPSGSGPPGPEELLGLVLDRPSWWAAPPGIHDQGYSRRFVAAQRLHGKARLRAFAKLDFDLMRNAAPVVVAMLPLDPFFFSDRVDPASLRYETAAGNWDIGALALK